MPVMLSHQQAASRPAEGPAIPLALIFESTVQVQGTELSGVCSGSAE
jgi:hypothetical protein